MLKSESARPFLTAQKGKNGRIVVGGRPDREAEP
jgi:hypothetical protein